MDKFWEKMTLDEKCDQLRERIEMLVVEIANDQRKLHDRLVKLEQAHEARAQRCGRGRLFGVLDAVLGPVLSGQLM